MRFSSSFLILQKLSVEHDLVFYLKDPNIIVITYYYSFIYKQALAKLYNSNKKQNLKHYNTKIITKKFKRNQKISYFTENRHHGGIFSIFFMNMMLVSIFYRCVCLCLHSFTVEAFSDCKTSETYLRGTDQRCYVVSIIPGASANFLHLHL